MWRWFWWSSLSVLCACTTPNPAASCADGGCPDPAFPFCDVDGAITGNPLSCTAIRCTPGETVACRDEGALVSDETGADLQLTPCAVDACLSDPTPHCPYLEPKYLPDVCDTTTNLPALSFASSGTFDTNLDTNCTGGVHSQGAGPELCVVRAASMTIENGASLKITGSRVVAFVTDADLRIEGILDVSADSSTNGPGGGFVKSGGMESCSEAGGGAGFLTAGAAGGNDLLDGGGENGGAVSLNPSLLQALVGGTQPLSVQDPPTSGGGGGGATLVSCRGKVVVTGMIDAGGGGGAGGFQLACEVGAAGGGSGGNVVLQGLGLELTGAFFANGGGGGSGKPATQNLGLSGSDGLRDDVPAPGGSAQDQGGRGGDGGAEGFAPKVGGRSTATTASFGGGGGSVGFFQPYAPANATLVIDPTASSPSFQPPLDLATR